MRIDAHIHYTPPSLAENMADYAKREPLWSTMIFPHKGKHSIQGWADEARMLQDMDAAGIERVVIQGAYRQSMGGCIEENDKILALVKKYPQRVSGFAMLYPADVKNSLEELKRCIDGGLLGVGELNPYAQNFSLDSSEFEALAKQCIEQNIPINFHTNEEIGHAYAGKGTVPLRHFYHLAVLYPELRIILAHWGGGIFFYEIMPEVRRVMRNVWYDMAASPLLFPTQKILNLALACVDHHKILYGSDYPLLVYPRRLKEPGFELFLEEIRGCALPEDILEDVLGNNAARLLGWMKMETEEFSPGVSRAAKNVEKLFMNDGMIDEEMPVRLIAQRYPESRSVLDKYGIAWNDSPVPYWETFLQAAAARGWNDELRRKILNEMNENRQE